MYADLFKNKHETLNEILFHSGIREIYLNTK